MMRSPRFFLFAFVVLLFLGVGILFYLSQSDEVPVTETIPSPPQSTPTALEQIPAKERPRSIGTSVEGRPIELYTFGTGDTHLLFVGGIHGGYEWNSVLLAYAFIDHITQTPDAIPSTRTVHIIPSLNPDGVFKVTGKEGRFLPTDVPTSADTSAGRFNAHAVDLNRNFACKWQIKATWKGKSVSAGTYAFSEPEAAALRDIVNEINPQGVVFWHSKANAVYASECEKGILPETRELMNTYAQASGYRAVDVFDAYPVTGDAEGWLASIGIPAVTVELGTHDSLEWEKNLRGVSAVLETY